MSAPTHQEVLFKVNAEIDNVPECFDKMICGA